ncbi:MAG: orotidine-5'-phosphate decarboxylase [Candidatus Nanoarchaeia archaeon]|jgi:orotidine-5'-phosphate decarboxylase|nr:orotidine-5'-phosphate decarboxylase [Candidatus Nanoarchaeia archaeon]|tara:strand:- start:25633 stop:26427 length:795 start_codon:yes stop_codon:yes gene_type:complete
MLKLTEKEEIARKKVCLPLDGLDTLTKLRERVEELSPVAGLFKVGKESYTRFGPKAVELVQMYGSNVFLDLKYHDIPETVKGAANAATQLGVYMFNVHASGGIKMMEAAVEGAKESAEKYGVIVPKIVGVTILTSIDRNIMNKELRIEGSVEDHVRWLAYNSGMAELDGVVCSAADLNHIKKELSDDFIYVTPGVKGLNDAVGSDQKRVFTPGNAIRDGSSILVIGRAITDPRTKEQKDKNISVNLEMQLDAGYEILKDMAKHL